MGKSFKKNNGNFSENRNRDKSNDYKRRKNQIREEHVHDELSDYKIHGFKKEKFRYNINNKTAVFKPLIWCFR